MNSEEIDERIDFHDMPNKIGIMVANGTRIYSYDDVPEIIEWIENQLPVDCANDTVLVVGRMPNYVAAAIAVHLRQVVGRFFIAGPTTPMYEVFDVRCPEVY